MLLDTIRPPGPRHNEIGEALAEKIFKECEPVLRRKVVEVM
jgi:hypothetical protein